MINKDPRRCKLGIDGEIIEQIIKVDHLRVEITTDRNITAETTIKQQE